MDLEKLQIDKDGLYKVRTSGKKARYVAVKCNGCNKNIGQLKQNGKAGMVPYCNLKCQVKAYQKDLDILQVHAQEQELSPGDKPWDGWNGFNIKFQDKIAKDNDIPASWKEIYKRLGLPVPVIEAKKDIIPSLYMPSRTERIMMYDNGLLNESGVTGLIYSDLYEKGGMVL